MIGAREIGVLYARRFDVAFWDVRVYVTEIHAAGAHPLVRIEVGTCLEGTALSNMVHASVHWHPEAGDALAHNGHHEHARVTAELHAFIALARKLEA